MPSLTADQVYAAARAAGATPNEAIILTAIAKGESGWNPRAHNPNAGTGDNSYGLWQINMLGSMGPARRKTFGISSNEELFDPTVNARAALSILRSQGWGAWTIYRKGVHQKWMPEAQAAARRVGDNFAASVPGSHTQFTTAPAAGTEAEPVDPYASIETRLQSIHSIITGGVDVGDV